MVETLRNDHQSDNQLWGGGSVLLVLTPTLNSRLSSTSELFESGLLKSNGKKVVVLGLKCWKK